MKPTGSSIFFRIVDLVHLRRNHDFAHLFHPRGAATLTFLEAQQRFATAVFLRGRSKGGAEDSWAGLARLAIRSPFSVDVLV